MPRAVREILVEARELIDKRGWCQFQFAKRDPHSNGGIQRIASFKVFGNAFCPLGAIMAAGGAGEGGVTLAKQALAVAAGLSGDGHIPGWNDRPGRTKAEVLAVFDKAIKTYTPLTD